MKKYLMLLLLMNGMPFVKGAVGCMDNSCHVTECAYDYKVYRYVEGCTCPCNDIDPVGGECLKCWHMGNPNRGRINDQDLSFTYQ